MLALSAATRPTLKSLTHGAFLVSHVTPKMEAQSLPCGTCGLSPKRWHTSTLWTRTQHPQVLMVTELLD